MKSRIILTVFACFFALCVNGQDKSRVITAKVESAVLGCTKEYSVYFPAGYETCGRDYPVLYLLHGASDTHRAWLEKGNMQRIADRVIAEGMALPMVIILPDAAGEDDNNTGARMGYFNRPGWNYEDFFFEELIPHVEKEYRIGKEKGKRALAGLSMGGGGSMVYALHRPDMFGSACPLSGLLGDRYARHTPSQKNAYRVSIGENDPNKIINDATPQQLDSFRTVRWYLDCGDDDFLADINVEMFLLMRNKNIPLQYRMRDGGHTWEYWQGSLPAVLQFISVGFMAPQVE